MKWGSENERATAPQRQPMGLYLSAASYEIKSFIFFDTGSVGRLLVSGQPPARLGAEICCGRRKN